ncbi:hypothetical protein GIB67_000912 [Kingdonia uniflora]|uniref:P-type ATPase A domain-containing protein n=1 Tax=Kingdonia uniflora TaxID=39325 RepID=A0A7J7MFI2_9MAGN|nr:hypothetical protein GIB67_000912 [Kingdonia uniflora]
MNPQNWLLWLLYEKDNQTPKIPIEVWQETNAKKAHEELKEMQSGSAKVLRDGYSVPDLPTRKLVPGDIVELRVGDKVPADMRIATLKTSTLRVQQSTTVVNGSCICIVGMPTEIGKIQTQMHEASLEESGTYLKKKLDEFGVTLTTAIGVICLVVWVVTLTAKISLCGMS